MSDQINDGGPAFPSDSACNSWQCRKPSPGMSLRAYFAGKFVAAEIVPNGMVVEDVEEACRMALEYADALIAALGKVAK